jgi:hypothetical protein
VSDYYDEEPYVDDDEPLSIAEHLLVPDGPESEAELAEREQALDQEHAASEQEHAALWAELRADVERAAREAGVPQVDVDWCLETLNQQLEHHVRQELAAGRPYEEIVDELMGDLGVADTLLDNVFDGWRRSGVSMRSLGGTMHPETEQALLAAGHSRHPPPRPGSQRYVRQVMGLE